jgi:hypothetical protein
MLTVKPILKTFLLWRNFGWACSAGPRAKEYRQIALSLAERTVPGLRPNEAYHRIHILFPTASEKVAREIIKV